MRQVLITGIALAVLFFGTTEFFNPDRAHASSAAASPPLEAGLRAYCMRSRALLGHAYFGAHEKTCRSARRLLA